jgi:hypothetical protein
MQVGRGNRIAFNLIQPDKGSLLLDIIEMRIGKSFISLSGEYSLNNRKFNSLSIKGDDLSLQDIEIRIEGKKKDLSGLLGCDLGLSFPEKGVKGMQITGNITGEGLSLEKGLFSLSIDDLSFHMDLAGEKGFINWWDMKLGREPAEHEGHTARVGQDKERTPGHL